MRNGEQLIPDVVLGVAFLALTCAAVSLTRFDGGAAFISVANAVLLARLLTCRRRRWLSPTVACGVAGAIATAFVGVGPAAVIPLAPMVVGEALIAAVILERRSDRGDGIGSHAPLGWFLLAAGVVAPAITACGAAAVFAGFGSGSYRHDWLVWFTGHGLGTVTFTPVAVYILRGDARDWVRAARPRALLEAAGHALSVSGITVLAFAQHTYPLLFLPILPLVFAVFRIGHLGAASSIVVLAVASCGFTVAGMGPIGHLDLPVGMRIQALQFYLACVVLLVLPIAAELARRAALYRRLHDSEARYRLLTENSTDILLNLDVDGRIRFASPSIRQIGGYTPDEVIGKIAGTLIDPRDMPAVRAAHLAALADPSRTVIVEYRARTGPGELRWFETHTRAVLDDDGRVGGTVSAVRDVGHRKQTEERLEIAALTDTMTGLANRRAFDARLELAIARAAEEGGGCVALFDIDLFKQVNDAHGHAAGDAVLRHFGDLARGRMRGADFVARYGGEEFAMILPCATPEQARLVCDRLREALGASSVKVGGQMVRVTVSGGVAAYHAGSSPEGVMRDADDALYRAKEDGRDRLAMAA